MSRIACVAATLAVVATGAGAAAPVQAGAASPPLFRCNSAVGPDGSAPPFVKVRVRGITCHRAFVILTAWRDDRYRPRSGPQGWRCHKSRVHGERRYRCARNAKRLRFVR